MLTSVDDVISTLGGPSAAAELAGVGTSAVSNWKSRGKLPREKFLVFSDALKRSGNTVDPGLFGFAAPPEDTAL